MHNIFWSLTITYKTNNNILKSCVPKNWRYVKSFKILDKEMWWEPASTRTLAQNCLAATQSFKYHFVCQGSPFWFATLNTQNLSGFDCGDRFLEILFGCENLCSICPYIKDGEFLPLWQLLCWFTSSCVSYTIAFIRVLHQIYFVANIKCSAIAQKGCLDRSFTVCVRAKIE